MNLRPKERYACNEGNRRKRAWHVEAAGAEPSKRRKDQKNKGKDNNRTDILRADERTRAPIGNMRRKRRHRKPQCEESDKRKRDGQQPGNDLHTGNVSPRFWEFVVVIAAPVGAFSSMPFHCTLRLTRVSKTPCLHTSARADEEAISELFIIFVSPCFFPTRSQKIVTRIESISC